MAPARGPTRAELREAGGFGVGCPRKPCQGLAHAMRRESPFHLDTVRFMFSPARQAPGFPILGLEDSRHPVSGKLGAVCPSLQGPKPSSPAEREKGEVAYFSGEENPTEDRFLGNRECNVFLELWENTHEHLSSSIHFSC